MNTRSAWSRPMNGKRMSWRKHSAARRSWLSRQPMSDRAQAATLRRVSAAVSPGNSIAVQGSSAALKAGTRASGVPKFWAPSIRGST